MFKITSLFARPSHKSDKSRDQKRNRNRALRLEALDPRLMFSVTPIYTVQPSALRDIGPVGPTQQQIDQQMGLPALDSLPGATATLYLDFDGNFLSSWTDGNQTFKNVSTPVWDMDGDKSHYSAAEQSVIKEVWARVAEDYAPFNINVSTDYYGSFNNAQALRVAIGGDPQDWLHADASGISFISSFTNDQPNVVFAFDMLAWAKAGVQDGEGRAMNGPEALATTISHEAGHSFGLFHHSTYDAHGNLVDEYDPGSFNWTPIMGNNKADDRTTWTNLPNDQGANVWQDDMAVIGGQPNGFGFRADDFGNTVATAGAMTATNAQSIASPIFTSSGLINQPNDVDYFKFTAPGGSAKIEVDAAKYGPNLLPFLSLWTTTGKVADASFASPTQSIINANLTAGQTYYVKISGFGEYGDVGQYTVSVSRGMDMTKVASFDMAKYTAVESNTSPAATTATTNNTLTSAGSSRDATSTVGTHKATLPSITLLLPNATIGVGKLLTGSTGNLPKGVVDAIHSLDQDWAHHV